MSLSLHKKDSHIDSSIQEIQQSPVYAFVCAKGERLVTAMHLITRHINEHEPLRTSLRTCSVDLLTLMHIHDMRSSEDAILERISFMKSLLESAFHVGFISKINYDVVFKEYDDLAVFLQARSGVFGSTESVVGDTFFNIGDTPQQEVKETASIEKRTQAMLPQAQQVPGSTTEKKAVSIKDNIQSKGQSVLKKHVSYATSPQIEKRKSNRRDAILNLLKHKPVVSVKDVASVVIGVSEKTLQRELLSLVKQGVLKKEGERRWSTYRLV